MREQQWQLADEAVTLAWGAGLAPLLGDGAVIHLEGDLGAGKTTLSRGILRALGHEGAVRSPTYTLVEPYEQLTTPVYHFDLYRLGDPEELEFLGIRDYLLNQAILLIEWPSRGEGVLPTPDLLVRMTLNTQGGRRLLMQALSPRGEVILTRLMS